MSGRGRGSRRSQGGRGRGNNKGRNNNPKAEKKQAPKTRQSLNDYTYELGNKQASDFAIVTKYLINNIRQYYDNGNDIAQALEDRKEKDFNSQLPEREWSKLAATEANAARIQRENETYGIM